MSKYQNTLMRERPVCAFSDVEIRDEMIKLKLLPPNYLIAHKDIDNILFEYGRAGGTLHAKALACLSLRKKTKEIE